MAGERISYRDEIAGEIIRAIEAGTAPWQKPWKPNEFGARPFNPISGKPYRGINDLWLSMNGYADPRWMTYKQAASQGAQVRKGEKSATIEYWQWSERKPAIGADGKPRLGEDGKPVYVEVQLDRPRVFFAKVFNASQIDSLEPWVAPAPNFDPIERAEAIIAGCGVPILHDQTNRAFYSPWADRIHLNPRADFADAPGYYNTALHEIGHATGHESRLAREFGPFGSEIYAREELRAEIASYMLARDLGIGHDPSRHASYVESWLQALKEDKHEIFRAARDSEIIRTWLLEPEQRQALEHDAQTRKAAEQVEEQGVSETPMARAYLNVPFAERGAAREAGAKFDGETKRWYVPEGADPAAFAKWADQVRQAPAGRAAAVETKPATSPVLSAEVPKRVFIAVPYTERHEAKKLGARWSDRDKSWWISSEKDPTPFERWISGTAATKSADVSPVKEFGDFLESHGLIVSGPPIMDGEWHRVPAEGDRAGQKSGSYMGYLADPNKENDRAAGVATNFRVSQKSFRWVATGAAMTSEQVAAVRAQAAQSRERRDADRLEAAKVSAKTAYGVWVNLPEGATPENSPYLAAKGVQAHGVKLTQDGHVVVPKRDADGRLWGVQFCSPEGKHYLKKDLHVGTMHVVEPTGTGTLAAITPAMGGTIVVTEGYATAATIFEATGRPVVVAFDGGNLEAVARAVKERHPERELLIAADNDHANKSGVNVGMVKAEAAAKAVGALWTAPRFTPEEMAQKLTDFNDLASSRGKEAVRQQIVAALNRSRGNELARGIA